MKKFFVTCLIASSVAAVIGWIAFNRVRDENQVLVAKFQSVKPDDKAEASNGQTGSDASAGRARENSEILQLRNEVTQLRSLKAELEELRRENQQIRKVADAERDKIQAQWTAWVSSLRTNGVKSEDVVTLVRALTNDEASIRVETTKVLRQLGLERMMNSNLTAQAEWELRAAAKIAVPGLVAALKDPDAFVRANAAITLGFLREDPSVVVPALVERLSDDQGRVVGSAIKALGRLQGDAISAVSALMKMTQSPDEGLREGAFAALKQIDPNAAKRAGFE